MIASACARRSLSDTPDGFENFSQGLGRLDLRKKHRQSAFRASPLTDWRLGQVEILRLRHRSKPLHSHNASHVVAPTPLDEVGAPFVTMPWDGRRTFSMSAPVHYSLEHGQMVHRPCPLWVKSRHLRCKSAARAASASKAFSVGVAYVSQPCNKSVAGALWAVGNYACALLSHYPHEPAV